MTTATGCNLLRPVAFLLTDGTAVPVPDGAAAALRRDTHDGTRN
jgi:hypothetical protein